MPRKVSDREIVAQLLRGSKDREIAARIGCELTTVKGHLQSLFEQFQISGGSKRVKLAVLLAGQPVVQELVRP